MAPKSDAATVGRRVELGYAGKFYVEQRTDQPAGDVLKLAVIKCATVVPNGNGRGSHSAAPGFWLVS